MTKSRKTYCDVWAWFGYGLCPYCPCGKKNNGSGCPYSPVPCFVLTNLTIFVANKIKSVRVVAEIPHPRYKIQIFNYNARYLVKIELGQYEQTFKIPESDVAGLEEVQRMVTDTLLKNSLDRFLTMRSDWEEAFQQKQQ